MDYNEKFDESEKDAHRQNIATKILREMSDLRAQVQNNPNAPRRWAWELVQNAKDVHRGEGVTIRIDIVLTGPDAHLTFKHNGLPFSIHNIRYLIEQISSKDRSKDESGKRKSTGKFGTGFLTTHLLSEKVNVKGVVKEEGLPYRKFTFDLDRSGYEPADIIAAVQQSKDQMKGVNNFPIYADYDPENFNTEFRFPLTDSVSHTVAKTGMEDLMLCLPLSLIFVPDISAVYFESTDIIITRNPEKDKQLEGAKLYTVIKGLLEPDDPESEQYLVIEGNLAQIAIPVKTHGDTIIIQEINNRIPTLFCDFPLIGTEKFRFPTIINSALFNPTDPRDGIFLTTPDRHNPDIEQNKQIIKEAVQLYTKLLDMSGKNGWSNLHLLARINAMNECPTWLDEKWYNQNVLEVIREKILKAKIVTDANGNLQSILIDNGSIYMWFPFAGTKELRMEIWQLANQWFPSAIPAKADVEIWNKIIWDKCGRLTTEQFTSFIASQKTLSKLAEKLPEIDPLKWLNNFYSLIRKEEKVYDKIVNQYAIFPNQNGMLSTRAALSRESGDVKPLFKEVLEALDNKILSRLADVSISKEIEFPKSINQTDVIRELTTEVIQLTENRESSKRYQEGFKKLLVWFHNNAEDAQNLFPTIYEKRHLLYNEEEMMVNIEKAEELTTLLAEFNAENISSLRELIQAGKEGTRNSLLPITQNLLASMGITSPEEWEKAMQDKDLAALFAHESTPNTEIFMYVQTLISTARDRIIEYLKTLPEYDMTAVNHSTAATILSSITKNGIDISIVARPAYDNYVIIYYPSERDILDYETSELWVDDGTDAPRKISMGHIFKKASIVKFPV